MHSFLHHLIVDFDRMETSLMRKPAYVVFECWLPTWDVCMLVYPPGFLLKMNFLSFIHPKGITNLHDFLPIEHKKCIFKENLGYSFQYNESE